MKFKLLMLIVLALCSVIATPSLLLEETVAHGQSSSTSTVWREYPYIAPHLVENSARYVYVTDWGNYTFPKLMPYVCKYAYRNGKQMVSFSTFWFNTTEIKFPRLLDFNVVKANNTFYEVKVTAYNKLKILGGKPIAYVVQRWNFNRTDKPKVSVVLTKTENYAQGDFQFYWIVAGASYLKENSTKTIDINKTTTLKHWRKDFSCQLGFNENVTEWKEWVIVDWS